MTPEPIATELVRVSRHQLREKADRIASCVDRLTPEQIWSRAHETENAIGNLILHLCGNINQWILAGIGDRPHDRNRDAEFSRREPVPTDELLARLREAVERADAVLAGLSAEVLCARRAIQVYDVTVLEAVYHVVEHLAQHTGQIIWATKRMTGTDLGFYSYLRVGADPSRDRRP